MSAHGPFDRVLRLATGMATARSGGLLTTFAFHRVMRQPCPIMTGEHDVASFSRVLGWITSQYRVLDPVEACERLSARSLPSRAAVISFDDGYRCNFDAGLPVLTAHGVPAIFFIATGFTGGAMFNDRVVRALALTRRARLRLPWLGCEPLASASASDKRRLSARALAALVRMDPARRDDRVCEIEQVCGVEAAGRLMMDEDELRRLHDAGMRLGGHTRNHPVLTSVDTATARREIDAGRDDLRAITGEPPRLFAYPNGRFGRDYTAGHCVLVRQAGFAHAYTTDFGVSSPRTDAYRLNRIVAWRAARVRFGLGALSVAMRWH